MSSTARHEAIIDRGLHLVAITAAVAGGVILLRSLAAASRPELEMPIGLYILGLLSGSSRFSACLPNCSSTSTARKWMAAAGTYSPFLVGAASTRIVGTVYVGFGISASPTDREDRWA